MTAADPSGPMPPVLPMPRPSRWAGLSWIWAIPAVALLIVVWLGARSLIERGPTIKISFATGDGIEAGRTAIRYKNVELGHVIRLGLSRDRKRVVAIAAMTRQAEAMLRAKTEFWVVRPHVGFSGISGLTTLVSGAYIGMLPGTGEPGARSFAGLETPPPLEGLEQGQQYTLIADSLPSVSDEAPVYYHGVKVGEVVGHHLSDKDGTVAVDIFIEQPHQTLIHPQTRFWVSSGVQVSVGAQGLTFGTQSLQSLLTGGIVLDTPKGTLQEPPSPAKSTFHLYADPKAAEAAADPLRVSYQLHFPGSVRGIAVDTPVELRGIPVGRVSSVRLEYDPATDAIRVPVTIEIEPNKIEFDGHKPFLANQGPDAQAAMDGMFDRLIVTGLRAQIASGNLLTGSRVIELDIVDDAPPGQLVRLQPFSELPTVPGSGLDEMTRSASKFLDKLAALPLGPLVGEIRDMVRHTDRLISSPALRHSLHELDRTLANAEQLTREAQGQVGPLMTKLNTAATQLNATLSLLGSDPRSSVDLAQTLGELKDAARSVRVLADYLERHPEALLSGKPEDALR